MEGQSMIEERRLSASAMGLGERVNQNRQIKYFRIGEIESSYPDVATRSSSQ